MRLLFPLTLVILCVPGIARAYEFRFGEGTNAPCSVCSSAPGSWGRQLFLTDGKIYSLLRKGSRIEDHVPFLGFVTGVISNDSVSIDVPQGEWQGTYLFKNGLLRSVSGPEPADSPRVLDLRRRLSRHVESDYIADSFWVHPPVDNGRNFWHEDDGRWKLWFENPNESGAFLALVSVLAVGGLLTLGGFWRVLCLFAAALAFCALVQTGSRGGMIGFLAGAGIMCFCVVRRRLTLRRMAGFLLAVIALAVAVVLLFGHTRIIGNLVDMDEGNMIRLTVWSSVPRMMACAPLGWWRPTGFSYCDWFQSPEFVKPLRYLLGSHQSVMVYGGYGVAFAYVFLWIAILHAVFREAFRRERPLALGLWVALGVMMSFSPIGLYHWEPWALPLVALGVSAIRTVRARGVRVRSFGLDALIAFLLVAALATVGVVRELRSSDPFIVRRIPGGVRIGHGEIRACVLDDGFVLSDGIIGETGKGLRTYAAEHPRMKAVKVADSWEGVPGRIEKLVLTGARCTEYLQRRRKGLPCPQVRNVYLVSPEDWQSAWMAAMMGNGRIRLVLGSLVHGSAEVGLWPTAWQTVVPGAAVYIPDWPRYIGL